MKTFSFPNGRAYMTVRSTHPDPASRFSITIADDARTSAKGLIDLGKFLIETGREYAKDEAANGAPVPDLGLGADDVVVTSGDPE